MKKLTLFILCCLLVGCAPNITYPVCTTLNQEHGWGMWTNEWPKENDFGYMKQTRYCENCGLRQSRVTTY